ncbi:MULTISPECIES: molybdopterin oxidoreductase family protein [Kamptonema]|uniref:molybdopterin oxidoreductase family protein n=1 Tax=Kamptonema TaxID=1501433 RepID=UPI0001DACE34|nr:MULTISPECIES: nitrate reductase [Kamptonema]CBN58191.1 nitrate reductase [Kamptonema sp. PCC 6506]
MESIKTLCPYCGVGCGLEVSSPTKPGQSWKVKGDREHPSSMGMVCVKGATVTESIQRDRLLYPMMRDSLDEPFRRASWDEALNAIVNRIQTVRATSGPDALCMYGSGQFVTEDYYVAQKLIKGCLGTNNFDANSRLCMSSAVAGYVQSFGADGPPCCYDDLELTDCAFIIGSNTAECHPIIFNRLAKYHKKNADVKMIVVDPRRTPTAEAADLHLAIKPGTDIDLLNGIAYILLQWGDVHAPFIDECTTNFAAFTEVIKYYPPQFVADRCGISVDELKTAARYWQESKRILSLWSMGMNQSSEGTAKVRSLINLHLMTGQIGKPGCGPFSLTGQPNAMGGREAGGLSHILPGYRFVRSEKHRAEVEEFWGLPAGSISPIPGRTAWDMMTGLETGEVEFLWIAATNPAVSMPDLERTKAALRRSPFTVYQEAYYPTETAPFAHILLPATQWSEKTGVMTNSERRVTLCPAFQQPQGEALQDWQIFAEVGRRLGFGDQFTFQTSAEVHSEFVQLTRGQPCDMSGMSHDRLRAEGPMQWPLSEKEEGRRKKEEGRGEKEEGKEDSDRKLAASERLYTDWRFHTPDGKARFAACHSRGLAEPPDPNYPLVLTTGRLYGHWHTLTRTGRTEKINQMHPDPFIEIHPRDAEELGIENGVMVEVRSRRGVCRFPAKITKAIAPGTVFVPMHWGSLWADGAEANTLMHHESCPDSKQPELKACAVQLVPIPVEVVGEKSLLMVSD